jgi:hypothetical protein
MLTTYWVAARKHDLDNAIGEMYMRIDRITDATKLALFLIVFSNRRIDSRFIIDHIQDRFTLEFCNSMDAHTISSFAYALLVQKCQNKQLFETLLSSVTSRNLALFSYDYENLKKAIESVGLSIPSTIVRQEEEVLH